MNILEDYEILLDKYNVSVAQRDIFERGLKSMREQRDDLLAALKGDWENCAPNVQVVLSQALLGNYEGVKSMLREICSIHAKAIAEVEK